MLSEWYKVVGSTEVLEQGDILFSCPTLEVESTYSYSRATESDLPPAKIIHRDMIILSQSCDLKDGGIEYVQLCPIYPLESMPMFASSSKRGLLRSDRMPRFALLDKNDRKNFTNDFFVVDLASVQSLPLEYVREFAAVSGKRLRLCSPYREYLSQKFAYLFMRVGKPKDIPKF